MTFDEFIEEWGNNKAYIAAHTSGSTGRPKQIRLPKDFVKESAERTNSFFKIGKGSRLHSCVSADFIGGKMMAVRAAIAQATLTWETPSNKPLKEVSERDTIDLLAVVPSQMLFILENINSLPDIRNIIIGGGSIHTDLKKKIVSSGLKAFETYGMTETSSHIALRKVTIDDAPFEVLPGIEIGIDNENCLKIRFENGYEVQTNDIAGLVGKNKFFLKGRRDNIINSGGRKINPEEIERKISRCISGEFYITGKPDEKWGEKVVLVIEGNRESVDEERLKGELETILEKWERPKTIIYKEKLCRTPNGKLIRKIF